MCRWQVDGVQMYSAAKSSLVGVIESPDTLETVATLFVRILGHHLVQLCSLDYPEESEGEEEQGQNPGELGNNGVDRLAADFRGGDNYGTVSVCYDIISSCSFC